MAHWVMRWWRTWLRRRRRPRPRPRPSTPHSSANNLNSSFPIRLQYYWIDTHFLIGHRPFERINNIENPFVAHWVMWWWKFWLRRRPRSRSKTPYFIELGVGKTSTYNNFMSTHRIWLIFAALESAWIALQLGVLRFLRYAEVHGGWDCTEFWSFEVHRDLPNWELEFCIGRSEPEKQIGGCYWSNP